MNATRRNETSSDCSRRWIYYPTEPPKGAKVGLCLYFLDREAFGGLLLFLPGDVMWWNSSIDRLWFSIHFFNLCPDLNPGPMVSIAEKFNCKWFCLLRQMRHMTRLGLMLGLSVNDIYNFKRVKLTKCYTLVFFFVLFTKLQSTSGWYYYWDVIYTSGAYAMMPVRPEVHWRIIANLGFKFRSQFTARARLAVLRADHLAPCYS